MLFRARCYHSDNLSFSNLSSLRSTLSNPKYLLTFYKIARFLGVLEYEWRVFPLTPPFFLFPLSQPSFPKKIASPPPFSPPPQFPSTDLVISSPSTRTNRSFLPPFFSGPLYVHLFPPPVFVVSVSAPSGLPIGVPKVPQKTFFCGFYREASSALFFSLPLLSSTFLWSLRGDEDPESSLAHLLPYRTISPCSRFLLVDNSPD